MNTKINPGRWAIVVGALWLAISGAQAQTRVWEGISSTVFNEDVAWVGGGPVPEGDGATARFSNSFDGTATFTANWSMQYLAFMNDDMEAKTLTMDFSGGSLAATTEVRMQANNITNNRIVFTGGNMTTSRLRWGYSTGVASVRNILEMTGATMVFTGTGTGVNGIRLGHNAGTANNTWIVSDNATASTAGVLDIGYNSDAGLNTVEFKTGASVTVSQALRLGFGTGAGNNNLTVDGATLTASDALRIGAGAGAGGNTVDLTGGATATVASTLEMGVGAGSGNNALTLGGGAGTSTLTVDSTMIMGMAEDTRGNTVTVLTGGELDVSGELRVGAHAGGNSLLITGGKVTTGNTLIVGYDNESDGNLVRVSGAGASLWAGATGDQLITVGVSAGGGGNNRLEVLDGATVVGSDLRVGQSDTFSGDALLVDGSGSTMTVASMRLGIFGHESSATVSNGGTLTIEDGGAGLLIGTQSQSTGNELVISAGTLTVEGGNVALGQRGANTTVRVENGGLLDIQGSGDFGMSTVSGSDNELIIDGGTVRAGAGREFQVARSEVILRNNGVLEVPSILLQANGTLSGSGSILGSVAAEDTVAGSFVNLGNSRGKISVDGNWASAHITLALAVGDLGAAPESGVHYDLLEVLGQFTHGGAIEIDLDEAAGDFGTGLQVLSWLTELGDSSDTAVSLNNAASAFDYEWRSDGLYVIPEPSSLALVVLAAGLLGVARRKQR